MNVFKKIAIAPIRFYRKFLSPLSPGHCRYDPTCSKYAMDAIEEWGVIRGIALGIWRILRCNPWSRGGYDPVPVNKRRRARREKKTNKQERKQ